MRTKSSGFFARLSDTSPRVPSPKVRAARAGTATTRSMIAAVVPPVQRCSGQRFVSLMVAVQALLRRAHRWSVPSGGRCVVEHLRVPRRVLCTCARLLTLRRCPTRPGSLACWLGAGYSLARLRSGRLGILPASFNLTGQRSRAAGGSVKRWRSPCNAVGTRSVSGDHRRTKRLSTLHLFG